MPKKGVIGSKNAGCDPKKHGGDPKKALEESILTLISENTSITYDQIAEKVNVARATVKRAISRLRERGAVKRIGGKKGGYWEVVKLEVREWKVNDRG
ncbi:MAG: winged helix-turn-helix transcriptional regulator [Chitinivibrionales bacterium]|nr:winged helix-turn-helix transcriptional regulator [Chitinivibrionales bacterium]MBD3357970.1 winged helix-turn-helix transcriptional regulator [Chitinivibrionales bacterium]